MIQLSQTGNLFIDSHQDMEYVTEECYMFHPLFHALQGCRSCAGPRLNLRYCIGWGTAHFRPPRTGGTEGLPATLQWMCLLLTKFLGGILIRLAGWKRGCKIRRRTL
jgi:hypothetical protein